MKGIDSNKTYYFGDYSFINYISLSYEEKEKILSWRNNINNRKWMFNTNIISLEDHLSFIYKLKSRDDSYYWLVIKNNVPLGGINLIHVNYNDATAEIGYFLDPDKQAGGLGLDFVFNALKFSFEMLNFELIKGNVMDKNKAAYILNSFLGFKYLKEYTQEINETEVLFQYCVLTKLDFYNDIESKTDIDKFIQFYRKNKK